MKHIARVFNRVWALEFYKTNATFFLVVLGFAGGFMRSADHIALGEGFVAAPALLSIPIVIWIIYLFQIFQFNQSTIRRKENEFMFLGGLLERKNLIVVLFLVAAIQLIPVYLYGLFLAALAFKHDFLRSATIVAGTLVLLHITLILLMYRTLLHPNQDRPVSFIDRIFDRLVIRPYPLMAIEWVARRKPIALIGFKIFGCLLLYGVSRLYETSFDARFLGMSMTIVSGLQMTMVYEIHRFDNVHFSLLRQLPISVWKKTGYTTAAFAILLLPESGMVLSLFPLHLPAVDCMATLAFGYSSIALFYAFLYVRDRSEEQVTTFAFGGVMSFFILILSHVPITLLTGINLIAAYWMIRKYYYRFELISR